MGAAVSVLSHKSSLSNVEKLVTARSVGSPTILLLRGSVSESDSLSYPRAENKDLVGPRLRAVLSFRSFSLRKRGERSVAKLLLRLTLCYIHNVDSVVAYLIIICQVKLSSLEKVLDFREFENEIGIRDIKYNETKFS